MTTDAVTKAHSQPVTAYSPGVYIEDSSGQWIDVSKMVDGQNRLVSTPTITATSEKQFGVLQTTEINIVLDNSDGMFNGPLVGSLHYKSGADDYRELVTTAHTTPTFELSQQKSQSVLYRRKCRITMRTGITGSRYEETVLNTYLIWDVSRDVTRRQVTLQLVGLAKPLMEADADVVKNGRSWWTNKPASFLIEELLKVVYGEDGGGLPGAFNLQRLIQIPVTDGTQALSHYGRPPEWDGTNWNDVGKYPTALSHGDVGAVTDKEWVGLEDELWYWTPATDTWVEVTEVQSTVPAGHKIRRIFHFNGAAYLVTTTDPEDDTYLVSMRVMKLTESGGVFTCTLYSGGATWGDSVYAGVEFCRPGKRITDSEYQDFFLGYGFGIGNYGQITTGGGFALTDAGENAAYTFSQRSGVLNDNLWQPRVGTKHTGFASHSDADDPNDGLWDDNDIPNLPIGENNQQQVPAGHDAAYAFGPTEHATDTELPWVRYWTGGKFCIDFSPDTSGGTFPEGNLYFFSTTFSITDSTPAVDIYRMDLSTGVVTAYAAVIPDGYLPCSLCASRGANGSLSPASIFADSLFIGVMQWDDDGSNAYPNSTSPFHADGDASYFRMYHFRRSTGTAAEVSFKPETFFDAATNDDYKHHYWTIVEMVHPFNAGDGNPASSRVIGLAFNRQTLQYAVVQNIPVPNSTDGDFAIVLDGIVPNRLVGLCVNDYQGGVNYYETGAGRVWQRSTASGHTVLDSGNPAVYDEYDLAAGLVVDDETGAVYGISAPTAPYYTQETPPPGRYYLFQADDFITDRIELADFEGMSCWDAIKDLVLAVNATAGFDRYGNFYFRERRRTDPGTADHEVGMGIADGVENQITALSVASGFDEIFNYCQITPYATELQDPKYELRMVPRISDIASAGGSVRASDREIPLPDFHVDVRTVDRKTVRAICTREGATDDGLSRFRYQTTDVEFEIRVTTTVTSGAVILPVTSLFGGNLDQSINDLTGVQPDDFILVTNPDDDSQEVRRITDIDPDVPTITVQSSFSFDIDPKTPIRVVKGNSTNTASGQSQWSDDGVTYVTTVSSAGEDIIWVATSRNLSVGTRVQFIPTSNDFNQEGNKDYLITNVEVEPDPSGHPGEDRITIDPALSNGLFWDGPPDAGYRVLAWWAPPGYSELSGTQANAQYSEIGGSRCFVKWMDPLGGKAEVDYTRKFRVGDIITIECPGLKSTAVEHAKQVFVYMPSVVKYGPGRKEWQFSDNKFIGRRVARQMVGLIVTTYRWPTATITLSCVMRPEIGLVNGSFDLTVIDVVNTEVFSHRPGFKERCVVRSVAHNLANRTTQLLLKAINPY